jgi:hypothetical protein
MVSEMDVLSARTVGNGHKKMRLRPATNVQTQPLDAILFNNGADERPLERFRHIVCHVRWNRWRDSKKIQLVIKDFLEA